MTETKIELTMGMLDILPGFNGDDLAVCAYHVLQRYSITVLEMQFRAGSTEGHGVFDASGSFMYIKETIGPAVAIDLLTVGPCLPHSVRSSLCALETYAELLTGGCAHPWKNVRLTTITHAVSDLCLRLLPVQRLRNGDWDLAKVPLIVPLAGVYRGEWFDRSRWNATKTGRTNIWDGWWTVRSQPKRDSVRRLVLDRHRGNASRTDPSTWCIHTGDVWHARKDTTVWRLGFGWND